MFHDVWDQVSGQRKMSYVGYKGLTCLKGRMSSTGDCFPVVLGIGLKGW